LALTTDASGGSSGGSAGPVSGSWNDVVAAAENEGKVTL
jgi:iron(III) transport system substrate-binding protein